MARLIPSFAMGGMSLKETLRRSRLRLLQMHYESGVGHIGGNLSCLDLLLTLHHRVMGTEDTFVLSKGHAAGALYVTLWSQGLLSEEDLKQFHKDATRLAGHPPPHGIPGILFATGSLCHGLGLAAGVALGKRLRGEAGRVYCLMSDGEWNEGSSWEALTFISHHRLSNVSIIIDLNGLQGFGSTREVADVGQLADRFEGLALQVHHVDGHHCEAIETALGEVCADKASVIIAKTVKGRGVSFMENKMEWHYLPMSSEQYLQASEEIRRQ